MSFPSQGAGLLYVQTQVYSGVVGTVERLGGPLRWKMLDRKPFFHKKHVIVGGATGPLPLPVPTPLLIQYIHPYMLHYTIVLANVLLDDPFSAGHFSCQIYQRSPPFFLEGETKPDFPRSHDLSLLTDTIIAMIRCKGIAKLNWYRLKISHGWNSFGHLAESLNDTLNRSMHGHSAWEHNYLNTLHQCTYHN